MDSWGLAVGAEDMEMMGWSLFHVLWAVLALQSSCALIVDQSELLGQCSSVCESSFCSVPPLLRYGKYCGVQYSGCLGQAPCDDLDACCKTHDDCIGNIGNYLNKTCNHNLLKCVEAYKALGEPQFEGNTCDIKDVESSIVTSMRIAEHL